MRYLLDTSSFLWYVSDFHRLSTAATERLIDPESSICLSLVSIWEIAIKFNMGKLELPLPFGEFFDTTIHNYSLSVPDIQFPHLKRVAELPLHHRDPFDRLLVAQSQVENLPILTSDAAFDRYPVQRIW